MTITAHLRRPTGFVALLVGALLLLLAPGSVAFASGDAMQQHGVVTRSAANQTAPSADRADPTPAPSLGSSQSQAPDLADDNDNDASDFSGSGWVLLIPLIIVLVGGLAFAFLRGRRRQRTTASEPRDHR